MALAYDIYTTNQSSSLPTVLKPWILPTGNEFISDVSRRFVQPPGNVGENVPYIQSEFDDSSLHRVDLPHDWAIQGPFIRTGGGQEGTPVQGRTEAVTKYLKAGGN
ncbi:MAG TPA: hypothetical protein VGN61_13925 [Verrucomicrobiae bacterium]